MANQLTTQQVADELGVSKTRVIALIRAGRLPAEKVGVQYLVNPKDLERVRHRKPGRPKNVDAPTAARRATLKKAGMPARQRSKRTPK